MQSPRRCALQSYGIGLALGCLATWYALPAATLAGDGGLFVAPVGDLPTNLIGHLAYQAPGWHWPLLLAANLNWPVGQSIAMTDSNPLLSLIAKILASLREKPANLLGFWLAACLILQPVTAIFALRGLAGGTGRNALAAALTAGTLALLQPEWLFRVIHINLFGQFLLLLALGLAARGCRRRTPVPMPAALALLMAAVLVHPYLFIFSAMVLAAPLLNLRLRPIARAPGAGSGAREAFFSEEKNQKTFIRASRVKQDKPATAPAKVFWFFSSEKNTLPCLEAPLDQGATSARDGLRHLGLAVLLSAGLFVLLNGDTGGGGPGFGQYSMDLLGPVWPQRSGLFGPDLPVLNATGFQHEGFNYLGAGDIALAAVALGLVLLRRELGPVWRAWPGMIVMLLALAALAVTPRITAAGHVVLPIDCGWLERPFAVVRASGRAFWCVGFALMLAAVAYLAARMRPAWFAPVAACALALQWADTTPLRTEAVAYLAGAGQIRPSLTLPAGTTLYRTVPVCDPGAVVADEYRLVALRAGARLADARLAHDPPDATCAALRHAGLTSVLAPGETRLFLPSVRNLAQVTALGADTGCADLAAGRLCYRPRSILGSNRAEGGPGR